MKPSPSRRLLRAAALIGLALAILLVAGLVSLRRSFRASAATVTPPPSRYGVGPVVFADADHGVVAVIPAGSSSAVPTLFLTQDGGRTWSRLLWNRATRILSSPLSGSPFLVVAGSGPRVKVNGDGGRTWHTLPAPPGVLQPYVVYGVSSGPVLLSPTEG